MISISLNDLCKQYAKHLNSIKIYYALNAEKHVNDTQSVYTLHIEMIVDGEPHSFWYIGQTKNPAKRLASHKSSFRNCRVSTFIGLSSLFTPKLLNVSEVTLTMTVLASGLTSSDAKNLEKWHSEKLSATFGECVLSRPQGSGSADA